MDRLSCPQPIAEYINGLRPRFDVQTVILFGSRARGDHDEFSDWDLFIVGRNLPTDWRERTKAVRKGKPVGVDVIAWTKHEVRQHIYRAFILDIATEGVPLYGDVTWFRQLAEQYLARRKKLQSEPAAARA